MRTQLSLYVTADAAAALSAVRHVVDPVQSRLIPPHVTLCRDEELVGVSPGAVEERLATAAVGALSLTFGPVESFGTHGLLLPCVGGSPAFERLRAFALGVAAPRAHVPHVTLAHPRNPRALGNAPDAVKGLPLPLVLTFTHVHWIEQEGAESPWRIRHTFTLDDPAPPGRNPSRGRPG